MRLRNSLSKQIEVFSTIKPNQVSIYCCGVTVYDLCHLGHARSYINWDVLRRYLISKGYEVTFIQNFTDIDDKIIKRAIEENSSMSEVSERNITEFHIDMDSLGIMRPDRMPKATQCLDEISSLISQLVKKGAAYSIDGDVYFSVIKHSEYGKLSGRDLSKQLQNADGRIEKVQEERKRHKFDFALWKSAQKGEPSFPSEWGKGRPGWHIECSAMIREELGETIDIHLGGADLIFPHHENEIAQSEAANEKPLANYWLHNGMVNVQGEKMSKSLGNFATIRDILSKGISPMALRMFVLQAHYRKPLDFTDEALKAASKGWERLNNSLCFSFFLKNQSQITDEINIEAIAKSSNQIKPNSISFKLLSKFEEYMDDDLNTSGALSILFELSKPIQKCINLLKEKDINKLDQEYINETLEKWRLLLHLAGILGLKANFNKDDQKVNQSKTTQKIEELIKNRSIAKTNKDFLLADKIRNELKDLGIYLIDKPNGVTEWEEK